mmetsp:Transcript_36064/g.84209  ORF Transcript_36064/g.84209 Transcript_36064/m.84209 type:complete len:159 (-) Transcript_36064:278-754(-)
MVSHSRYSSVRSRSVLFFHIIYLRSWLLFSKLLFYSCRMGGLALVNNGDEVLESLGLKDLTWKNLMRNLGILVLVELGVSLVGLNVNGPRFIEANQKEKVENDGCVSNTRKFRTKKNFSERVEGSNKMDESSIRSKGSIPAANRAISKAFQVDVSGVL